MTRIIFGENEERLRDLFVKDLDTRFLGADWTKLPPIWAGGTADRPKIALVLSIPHIGTRVRALTGHMTVRHLLD